MMFGFGLCGSVGYLVKNRISGIRSTRKKQYPSLVKIMDPNPLEQSSPTQTPQKHILLCSVQAHTYQTSSRKKKIILGALGLVILGERYVIYHY